MRMLSSLKAICLTAGLSLAAGSALAQTCEDLAAPPHTKDLGVWWDEMQPELALEVCAKAVADDPDNHSNIAHLARVHSKLEDQATALALLEAIADTDNPDALAYLGILIESEDPERAFDLYEKAAANGHIYGNSQLASALLNKDGPNYDPERGRALRQANAEKGSILDAINLGLALMYGRDGATRDEAKAVELLHIAAEGRATNAYAELGRAYRYAIGVERDYEQAAYWLEKGVATGSAYSKQVLAYMLEKGWGVEADETRAIALLTEAGETRPSAWNALGQLHSRAYREKEAVAAWREGAKREEANSLDRLGWAYYFGNGVPKDIEEGVRFTVLGSDKGSVYAKERLADIVRNGILVPQDYSKAKALYEEGVDQGLKAATYSLGRMYLDGEGVDADNEKGIELLKQSAELGSRRARNFLAVAYTRGEGVEKSFENAVTHYEAIIEDNDGGVALAKSNLAELYEVFEGREPDLEKAEALYREAAESGWKRAMRRLANMQIEQGTPEALQEAGELYARAGAKKDGKALDRLDEAFSDAEDPLYTTLTAPSETMQEAFIQIGRNYEEVWIGCALLFVDCGAAAGLRQDLDYAATWYRRAGENPNAQFRLGAMLLAQPQVSQDDEEATRALNAAVAAGNADAALLSALTQDGGQDPSRVLAEALDALSDKDASRLAIYAVSGRFGDGAIGPAWTWLETQAKSGNAQARMGLVGAALFLGAFDLAADELDQVPDGASIDLSDVDYTVEQALTFLMKAVRKGVTPDLKQLDAMERLLTALSDRGAEGADALQLMLEEVRYRLATLDTYQPLDTGGDVSVETRLARMDERHESLLGEGRGVSPILVPMYQEYARLHAEAGNLEEAEASVYRSLAIAKSINENSRHLTGSLVFHMEMACHERKASDLLFEFGVDNAALALAKSAVNHLQAARRNLIGLPQKLQNCFRDVLADQYRRMADLLIRNGYLDEAQQVLAQLKDFETFRYSGEATARLGATFEPVPLSQDQSGFISQIHGLPISDLMALERERAALKKADAGDDALDAIKDQIKSARKELVKSLNALSEDVENMETDASKQLASDVSAKSLITLAGRLKDLSSVALVYSVSLPERTHFLIVTANGTEHHELELGETALNAMIEEMRDAVSRPSSDPGPIAKRFYNEVWAPVDAALSALEGEGQVLLALDGRMRYVPIPALMGPEGWLVNGHRYVTFTPATRDLLLEEGVIDALEVEGLGASRGGDGFTPLPYVKQELDTIVGLDGADGSIVPGRAWLDDNFDEDALAEALDSDAPVIHVATHFDLTEDEETSRLLLGTGETLSVAGLKEGALYGDFVINDVEMLVLSACSTGFSGGSELESLASEMQQFGVRTVLATLWPVADQSTAAFMAAFYAEMQDGAGRAEALHEVQRKFTQSEDMEAFAASMRGFQSFTALAEPTGETYAGYTHPFYWAGFQMIGQWR